MTCYRPNTQSISSVYSCPAFCRSYYWARCKLVEQMLELWSIGCCQVGWSLGSQFWFLDSQASRHSLKELKRIGKLSLAWMCYVIHIKFASRKDCCLSRSFTSQYREKSLESQTHHGLSHISTTKPEMGIIRNVGYTNFFQETDFSHSWWSSHDVSIFLLV